MAVATYLGVHELYLRPHIDDPCFNFEWVDCVDFPHDLPILPLPLNLPINNEAKFLHCHFSV